MLLRSTLKLLDGWTRPAKVTDWHPHYRGIPVLIFSGDDGDQVLAPGDPRLLEYAIAEATDMELSMLAIAGYVLGGE